MESRGFRLVALAAAAVVAGAIYFHAQPAETPAKEVDKKTPAKTPEKKKKEVKRCPKCGALLAGAKAQAGERSPQLGGLVSPDGLVAAVPLPESLNWPRNIASKGLGCCGSRALDYAARWQNVPELLELPEREKADGMPGGIWPEKLEEILKRYGKGAAYWNDTSNSIELVQAAVRSMRIPCVDYSGHDPHYGGGIAHIVNVVACDLESGWVAILDNNFPSTDQIVWMGADEFRQRWHGWCYGLLAQTPGHIYQGTAATGESAASDSTGTLTFGLVRPNPVRLEVSVLNGQPATVADILSAIGPEMAPIKISPIEVDHTVQLRGLVEQAAPVAAVIVVLYLFFAHRKDG